MILEEQAREFAQKARKLALSADKKLPVLEEEELVRQLMAVNLEPLRQGTYYFKDITYVNGKLHFLTNPIRAGGYSFGPYIIEVGIGSGDNYYYDGEPHLLHCNIKHANPNYGSSKIHPHVFEYGMCWGDASGGYAASKKALDVVSIARLANAVLHDFKTADQYTNMLGRARETCEDCGVKVFPNDIVNDCGKKICPACFENIRT